MHRPSPRMAVAAALIALTGCGGGDGSADAEDPAEPEPTAPAPTVPAGTPAPFESLVAGDCFNRVPDEAQQPYVVLVLECSEPHIYEVYNVAFYTDEDGDQVRAGRLYPGESEVRTRSEALCLDSFEPWMGTSWTASEFDFRIFWPSEQSWAENDRTILCTAYRFDRTPTTGSARGTAQ